MTPATRDVLLADDNEDFASTLAELLAEDGYRVRVARDGAEAVALYRDRPADLLLLDLAMPRKDGLSAFEEIRSLAPTVPAIFLTAYNSEALRLRVSLSPDRDGLSVMMKPVEYPELATRVATILAR